MSLLRYITHADVVIDGNVPVPQWGLNERGRERVIAMLAQPWVSSIGRIVSSDETKALDQSTILADHLGVEFEVRPCSGETDRSVPGYLPSDEFELVADAFFAAPEDSVRGWETARAVTDRIDDCLRGLLADDGVDTVVVGHGGAGTLWWCHLTGAPISRRHDQSRAGHYWTYDRAAGEMLHPWRAIDDIE